MTTSTPAPTRPDTHEMVVVHRVFRREAALLPSLVAAVAHGDVRRARRLAGHIRAYRDGLHEHHTGEDDLIWPLLLARIDLEADVVLRMELQHEAVAATLDRISAVLPAWSASAGAADRAELVAALRAHYTALVEHLDDEERFVLTLIAEHLTVAEWERPRERFAAEIPLHRQLLFLGAMLEDATAEERAGMLAGMPRPVRLAWSLAGRPWYTVHMRRIRRA